MKKKYFRSKISVKRMNIIKMFSCLILLMGISLIAAQSTLKAETIYVACLDDFSGPYAYEGEAYCRGVKLALKEANYTVLGKKIELITRDTELKPPVCVRKLREVVEKYQPFFAFQRGSSSVGLAVQQEALNLKIPMFIEGFATQITGSECNRYTFRWDAPNYAGARSGFVPFLKANPKIKTAYAVVENNASGKDMIEQQEEIWKPQGGKIIKTIFFPSGTSDFSSYLTELLSLKPDALILDLYGTSHMNCVKQVYEFGISKKMPVMAGFAGLTMIRGVPPEASEGIYYGVHWWHTLDNKWTKDFVPMWKKEYGQNPEDPGVAGYIGMWLVLKTAERVKSLKAKDLIIGLEKFGAYDGPTGKEFMRPWDHQIVRNFVLGKGKSVKDRKDSDDFLDIIGMASIYPNPTPEESACKFKIKDEDL